VAIFQPCLTCLHKDCQLPPSGDSGHDLDWLGSHPGGFAGPWQPTQFNSLVSDVEELNIRPSAPKGAIDFEGLTARLKPRPFKTKSEPEFFRGLLKPAYSLTQNDDYSKPVARSSKLEAVVLRSWDNAVAARVVCKTLRIQIW